MKYLSIKLMALGSFALASSHAISSETKLTIGGDLKLDAYFDTSTNNSAGPRGYDLLSFRSIPLEGTGGSEKSGGTKFHSRASKLYIKSLTPYDNGTIKTHLEGDFLGRVDSGANTDDDTVSNSYEFRLRQAYVSWGNWMAGQSWSNFVDLKAYPEAITFTGLLGRSFIRQAQIRYTLPIGGGDKFSFSVENPDTDFNIGTPAPGSNANEDDNIPDLIATYYNKMGKGHFRASLLLRSLGVDTTGTVDDITTAQSDSAIAWGVGLSGKLILSENFNLKWNINGGKGIGRYLYNNHYRSAAFTNGKLETEEAWGGNIMLQYKPSKDFRMNVGYGGHNVDVTSDSIVNSVTEKLSNAHLNAIWTVTKHLEVAAGVTHAVREVKSGSEGDITRFMFSVKRKFSATL